MALQLGETAPDFEAETTEGRIQFHDWIGDSWAVLFSHPKDFTPVCTTELGYMAKIKPEFDKRNVKIVGLSVDPVDKHSKWADDIAETQGHGAELPDDRRLRLQRLEAVRDASRRDLGRPCRPHAGGQPDRAERLRHRPGQEGQADPRLSDDDRPELRRGAARDRLAAADREAQGRDAGQLEGRRQGDHRGLGVGRRGEGDVSRRLGVAEALHPHRPAAALSATQAQKAADFRALHAGEPFIIPNPWDAGSARVLEGLGFKALATTSSGLAFTRGRLDGGATADDVFAHVREVTQATALPLSVDLENGYDADPDRAASALVRVAGGGRRRRLDRGLGPADRHLSAGAGGRARRGRLRGRAPAGLPVHGHRPRGEPDPRQPRPRRHDRAPARVRARPGRMCSSRPASATGADSRGLRGDVEARQRARAPEADDARDRRRGRAARQRRRRAHLDRRSGDGRCGRAHPRRRRLLGARLVGAVPGVARLSDGARRWAHRAPSPPALRLPLAVVVQLAADLAGRELRAVHVHIRDARADRLDELVELTCRDALARRADHVRGDDRARHVRLGRRSRGTRRLAAASAQEHRDTARVVAVAEVDVREERRAAQPDVGQRVRDRRRARVLVDRRVERSRRTRGDARRGRLLEARQHVRRDLRLVPVRSTGTGEHRDGQRDERGRGDAGAEDQAQRSFTHMSLPILPEVGSDHYGAGAAAVFGRLLVRAGGCAWALPPAFLGVTGRPRCRRGRSGPRRSSGRLRRRREPMPRSERSTWDTSFHLRE